MNFKNIHIGTLIKKRVQELPIETGRICNFLKCTPGELRDMYNTEDMSIQLLMRWSKLLEYDFFRLYSQHLILYAPPSHSKNDKPKTSNLPEFRKSIYTCEVIDFLLELIHTGKKTRIEIIEEYGIPKTTLYKWISKNKRPEPEE